MIPGKIMPGTVVEPISPNRGMAIFKSGSGGRFIRVKEGEDGWKGITFLEYKGPGLVIFLSDLDEEYDLQQIGPGEVLKPDLRVRVTAVFERHAVGEVVSENGQQPKSVEDLFNDLIDQIEMEDSPDTIEFGGEIFTQDDYPTLLKLSDALYSGETENEDGDSSAPDRGNEASNKE